MAKPKNLALLLTVTILTTLLTTACSSQGAANPTATDTPQSAQPTQPPVSQLTPTQLKYLLLDKYANSQNLLYCDPDLFPISVSPEGEQQRASAKLLQLQNNKEEYQAILQRNNLAATAELTGDQMLLVYRDSKKLDNITLEAASGKYNFTIKVGKAPNVTEGDGTQIAGSIDQSGAITGETRQDVQVQCPICLAGATLIDTPNGPVPVKDLRQGATVWTMDPQGARRPATILETVKRKVPSPHQMVHLALSDGRELVVSPRHPTTSGQLIGALTPGATLDNALIVKADRIPYDEDATYDILPSGETGFYWANGILIASTLSTLSPFPGVNDNNAPALHLHALYNAPDSGHQ